MGDSHTDFSEYRLNAEVVAGSLRKAGPADLPGAMSPPSSAVLSVCFTPAHVAQATWEDAPAYPTLCKIPSVNFTLTINTGDATVLTWSKSKLKLREEVR